MADDGKIINLFEHPATTDRLQEEVTRLRQQHDHARQLGQLCLLVLNDRELAIRVQQEGLERERDNISQMIDEITFLLMQMK